MLYNIFLISTMATIASTLPQAPAAAVAGPAPLPAFVPPSRGQRPNFNLIESEYEPKHNYFTSCWNTDLPSTPKEPNLEWQTTMAKCLEQYDVPNWDGQDCGGVGWFKAQNGGYQNPQHCFHACKGCINWSINSSSTDGYCWTIHEAINPNYAGGAPNSVHKHMACDMGYHISE
ncbi:hypothetical protein XANCAGTX0491_000812 [Xanthoria calcicola]